MLPLPNDQVLGGTVIASTWYSEADGLENIHDRYTLVVLMPASPYFKVTVVRDEGDLLVEELTECHFNIVHAINGDNFPYPASSDPSRMVGPRKDGYVDMGGDV